MAIKDTLAERLRIVQAYGTAEELAQVLDEITREKEREQRDIARKVVGMIPSLEKLGERIDKKREGLEPAAHRTKREL